MNNEIKIPKEFTLFGEKHQVRILKRGLKDRYGDFDPNTNVIRLLAPSGERTQDQVEQVFLHELVHSILDHLYYVELSCDERFVDRFAKALHQALKTSKYELKNLKK
jgi:hypothetical protein